MSIHETDYIINKGRLKVWAVPGKEVPLLTDGQPTIKPIERSTDHSGNNIELEAVIIGEYEVEARCLQNGIILTESTYRLKGKQINQHPLVGKVIRCRMSRVSFLYSEASQIEGSL